MEGPGRPATTSCPPRRRARSNLRNQDHECGRLRRGGLRLSFTALLRQGQRCRSFTSTKSTAPHGAGVRDVTFDESASEVSAQGVCKVAYNAA